MKSAAEKVAAARVRGYKAWERRRENEERAMVNLEPHMIPLWKKIGGAHLGSTPHERAERFAEYTEENPGEAIEALQDWSDRKLEMMIAQRDA
jgi:hypothetical protein